MSLDDLFHDASDERERKKGIPDQTEDALASISDIVDDGKNGKWKMIKWLTVAMGLLALTAVIYLFVLVGDESDFVPVNDLQKEEIESETGTLFDFEW